MIYLLGVNHRLQIKRNLKSTKIFLEFLDKKIDEYSIEIIAEEFSNDSLLINEIQHTTVQQFAKENKIQHIFIDPGLRERETLKIKGRGRLLKDDYKSQELFQPKEYLVFIEKVRKQFRSREEYWYQKIKEFNKINTLVICGSDHLITFSQYLEEKKVKCLIFEQIFN